MKRTEANAPTDDLSAPRSAAMHNAAGPIGTLVVDLDGTLITTDLLWESLFSALARNPTILAAVPFWLATGRARLKRRLATLSTLDVKKLPYRQDVLQLVRDRRTEGSRVVLATAADETLARRVADHLGAFDDVLASDGHRNCKGTTKRDAVRDLLGGRPYDYVGDSNADLPLILDASRTWLVCPSRRLRRTTETRGRLEGVLGIRSNKVISFLRLLRPHQAAKNLLIFVPILAGHRLQDLSAVAASFLAFLCFSMAASAVYILNDLFDLQADRGHGVKRQRPLAAGEVAIPQAAALSGSLMISAIALSWLVISLSFVGVLAGYLLLTSAYSLWLKKKVFADVIILAALYACRILAGGVATKIVISDWLIVFSLFVFLSLALVKRYCELDQDSNALGPNGRRGYRAEDLDLLRILGPVAGYLAVLVMALYISSEATLVYPRRSLLWLICPIFLYWITRIWFLAHRKEMHDDPVVFALKDKQSLAAGALTAVIILAASVQ